MPTYYRKDNERSWTALGDDVDLREWGRAQLEDEAFKDSDNGYSHHIEFDRDGERTYAYASYASYHVAGIVREDGGGEMEEFDYGPAERLKAAYGDHAVSRFEQGPGHDWLRLSVGGPPWPPRP